jgi:hypothetical protein
VAACDSISRWRFPACRSRGPANSHFEPFPLPSKEESDRIEDLNEFALVARTCLLGLVSCLCPGSLMGAALAPYGLYRMSLIGEELPFACSEALIPFVCQYHMHELASGS